MKTYIIRRLLLMPLTLIGVTFLVFCVTRFVPGGPVDQMMQEQTMGALSGEKATAQGDSNISEEDLERLEEQFNLQERTGIAYLQWLGIRPKKRSSPRPNSSGGNETVLTLSDSGRFVRLAKPEEGTSPASSNTRMATYPNRHGKDGCSPSKPRATVQNAGPNAWTKQMKPPSPTKRQATDGAPSHGKRITTASFRDPSETHSNTTNPCGT